MPYYVYKIFDGVTPLVKHVEPVEEFASYREAKILARELRVSSDSGTEASIKMIFADNKLQAEELLHEKRERPILKEWEK